MKYYIDPTDSSNTIKELIIKLHQEILYTKLEILKLEEKIKSKL
jgi:hypothetical protein